MGDNDTTYAGNIEYEFDIDGEGPIPPVRGRLSIPDDNRVYFALGAVTMTLVFLGLLVIY